MEVAPYNLVMRLMQQQLHVAPFASPTAQNIPKLASPKNVKQAMMLQSATLTRSPPHTSSTHLIRRSNFSLAYRLAFAQCMLKLGLAYAACATPSYLSQKPYATLRTPRLCLCGPFIRQAHQYSHERGGCESCSNLISILIPSHSFLDPKHGPICFEICRLHHSAPSLSGRRSASSMASKELSWSWQRPDVDCALANSTQECIPYPLHRRKSAVCPRSSYLIPGVQRCFQRKAESWLPYQPSNHRKVAASTRRKKQPAVYIIARLCHYVILRHHLLDPHIPNHNSIAKHMEHVFHDTSSMAPPRHCPDLTSPTRSGDRSPPGRARRL